MTTVSPDLCHPFIVIPALYVRLYGSYEAIIGGRVHDALLDMTGGIAELVELADNSVDQLTTILTSCYRMDTMMGGAIFVRRQLNILL